MLVGFSLSFHFPKSCPTSFFKVLAVPVGTRWPWDCSARQVISWNSPFLLRSFELSFLPGGWLCLSTGTAGPGTKEQPSLEKGAPSTAKVGTHMAWPNFSGGRDRSLDWLCAEHQVLGWEAGGVRLQSGL